MVEAGENYQRQDGEKKNAREGERYSLRGTTDGQTVAVVDEDILSNIDLSQWDKQTKKKVQAAAKEALKKFSDGIVVDGITKNVNRVSRNEYTGSKYSEKISKTMPQLYADKMRAASAIDDVVIAATDWALDGKLLHPRTDNFVDFDHGNVLIEVGRNQYVAEVVVGITNRGNAVFYDVVDIQPTQFTTIKEEPSPNVTTNKSPDIAYESSSDNTVPQQAAEVKGNVRYSSRNNRDSEYMELAKEPEKNRGRLQEMVEDAAKEAGYTEVAYHGTNSDFTVFDKNAIGKNFGAVSDLGFYFTPYYGDARGYSTNFGKEGAHVLKGALRFSNPLVVEDTGWGSAIEQMDVRHGDLLRWAQEGKHDGIIVRSLDEEFQDDDGSYDTVYVAFDSNQFKLLDPITYDNSGNVVPLSQRFNTENPDIRMTPEDVLIVYPEDIHMVRVSDPEQCHVKKCCFKFRV